LIQIVVTDVARSLIKIETDTGVDIVTGIIFKQAMVQLRGELTVNSTIPDYSDILFPLLSLKCIDILLVMVYSFIF
jgi:hypothetical protein